MGVQLCCLAPSALLRKDLPLLLSFLLLPHQLVFFSLVGFGVEAMESLTDTPAGIAMQLSQVTLVYLSFFCFSLEVDPDLVPLPQVFAESFPDFFGAFGRARVGVDRVVEGVDGGGEGQLGHLPESVGDRARTVLHPIQNICPIQIKTGLDYVKQRRTHHRMQTLTTS